VKSTAQFTEKAVLDKSDAVKQLNHNIASALVIME
jgi:hypothetical protein